MEDGRFSSRSLLPENSSRFSFFFGLVHLSAWFIDRKSATIFHLRTTPLQSYSLGFFGSGGRISKFQKDKDKEDDNDSEQMLKIPSLSNSECNVPILTQRIS